MTTKTRSLAIALLAPLFAAAAPRPAADGSVSALRLEGREGRTELTVEITGAEARWNDFALSGPPRVVVDVQGATSGLSASRYDGINRGGVRGVRTSQHAPDVVRVVVDLERATRYSVERVSGGLRISLEGAGGDFEPWSTGEGGGEASDDGGYDAPAAAAPARPDARFPQSRQQRAEPPQSQARRITVSFENTDMRDVLASFGELTGRSIVPGAGVGTIRVGYVTFNNQPWDQALRELLQAYDLTATETQSGIIRVERIEQVAAREATEPLVTRSFRLNYIPASEMDSTLQALRTERGSVTFSRTTNTVVVADVPAVVEDMARLIDRLDVRTPQVAIQAKIVFINREDAEELGITYDLKDSRGNSLNELVAVPDPETGDPTNDNLVLLGGNSIAALGNANARVADPALETVISLVLGRYTLITFIDALQRSDLADVQAAPSVTVANNHQAQIWVGERTPIRVVDLGGVGVGGTDGGANVPRATAELVETGIRLIVTPQVTEDRRILLTLHAERSSAEEAPGEIGVQFIQQQGDTRVLVNDGETAVIGGLTVTEVSQRRTGIPFLMDIPFLGSLFRTTANRELKRDLLIMVTPHVVEETR